MLRINVELEAPQTTIWRGSASQIHITGDFTLIKHHPQEINLGKVDQMWFLDVVLLKGAELHET